ncbi:U3 small nucleolar RNA-associated protein 6 [Trypanosoma melophagium]|uniref:U3 small nucleolar RNA-associated protein 6 n=1 Tax=Trypanosoma melophagium TaxID=715481 RepID=UPI00351A8239|nr:U3 small nucleolar RNA-associated protein 6 [Trypanosoma melophagium]
MARARAIETRLEKLLPSLEEYFTSGFLTRAETQDVARQRTHWEYRLVAKPLLLLDVQNAVAYELGLERRIREYCITTKLVLRHRWAVLERIESIYRIGIKHLKDPGELELLRKDFIRFLRDHERHSSLSALYGELMVRHPTRTDLWVEAALYEGVEMGNIDNGRAIVQQAILTAGAQPEVWNAAFLLELNFADRLLCKLVEEELQKESEDSDHDIVDELRKENSALASVVVDLALVKAVVEEALESPACGPKLVQQLLESATRFSYTKSLVEMLMENSALKMISALNPKRKSTTASHNWTDNGVSRFLQEYLTFETRMVEHKVTGDAASYLRCMGRVNISTPEDRKMACLKAFIAALTLAQSDVGSSSLLQRLRDAAVEVVVLQLESLQKFISASGISALCRLLLSGKFVGVIEALQCLCEWKKTSAQEQQQKQQQRLLQMAHSSAERVQSLLEAAREVSISAKKTKHEGKGVTWRLWRFLLPSDRKAVEASTLQGDARLADDFDVERLLHSLRDVRDDETLRRAVLQFLREFHLVTAEDELEEGLQQLQFSNSAKTPITLWRIFSLLEERSEMIKATPRSTSRDDDDDSSSEDEDDKSRKRSSDDESYAVTGLRFLASVPSGTLDRAGEEERLDGCWGLVSARVRTLTGLQSTTRADFTACLQRNTNKSWMEGVRFVLRVARLCEPLPRQVHTDIAIPFFESLALVQGSVGISAAIREARDAHERLLAMYHAAPKAIGEYLPLVLHVPRGEGVKMRVSPGELNAADWTRLVAFERSVAKDLYRAKETAARAQRTTLAPQQLLTMLNAC